MRVKLYLIKKLKWLAGKIFLLAVRLEARAKVRAVEPLDNDMWPESKETVVKGYERNQ